MRNFVLASTSTIHGSGYLEYLREEIKKLFIGIDEIIFIPYARASAMSHDEYTAMAATFFKSIDISVKGVHTCDDPKVCLQNAKGIFAGGGNTFLLVKQLYEHDLIETLKERINLGTPYLGTSAGSNIAGLDMKTTNDMPIVYPPSFKTMGIIPYNINPHYLDPDPNSTHKGETRETRILEYLSQNQNTVLGLREGNWIRGKGQDLQLCGNQSTRIFMKDKIPIEVQSFDEITIKN